MRPRWERWELELLVRSPALSHEALAALTGRQTPTAVGTMRGAVHAYHSGGAARHHRLTPVQMSIVDAYRGLQVCAVCGCGW